MSEYIVVDGETIPIESGMYACGMVLAIAGVGERTHDLIRIDPDGHHVVTHRYGDIVAVTSGDEFITARIAATD